MIENEMQRIVGALEKANVIAERQTEALIRLAVAVQNAVGKEVKIAEVKEVAAQTQVPDAAVPEVPRQMKRVRRTKAQIAADEARKLVEEVEKAKAEPNPEPVESDSVPEPAKPEPVVEPREAVPPADDDFLADPPAAAPKATTADARKALMDLAARKGGDAAARDAARGLIKAVTGYANMTEVDTAAGGAAEHELYGKLVEAANAAT